jgi:hypothetical protein
MNDTQDEAMSIEIPPHLPVVAGELKKLMRRIGVGLRRRPGAGELPGGLDGAIDDFQERVAPAVGSLDAALQVLSDEILDPAGCAGQSRLSPRMRQDICAQVRRRQPSGWDPSSPEEAVRAVMADIAEPVEALVGFLHDLRRRSFKGDLAPGKPLLAAMVERPLRDVRDLFEQIVDLIENPESLTADFGTSAPLIRFVLTNEEEKQALNRWIESMSRQGWSRGSGFPFSLPGLAAAFILGSWWGGE